MRKPWQLKARSIFLLFADGWVSSCPAGEEDSGLAGLARSIAVLSCPVSLSLSRLAVCLAVRLPCLAAWLHLSKAATSRPQPNQPNQLVTQFQSTINRIHIASQSMKPALTNVNDGSSDARRPATFAGTFGARSPSGLHGVWGALITNGSHHDLAIITGAPQQDPSGEDDEVLLLISDRNRRQHSMVKSQWQWRAKK